ncbi:MAG: hypothetical protein OEV06_02350 [Anaerolineae bacterium]|nr:hypothetical protein [Anaerolineae bacterium]
MTDTSRFNTRERGLRRRFGILLTLIGLLVFLIGARPDWFGLDRSPVIGFVQISVFLTGLGMISLGGVFALLSVWNGEPKSIAADLGLRVVATGYVFALASGMADVIGLGTRPLPGVPFFGYWQARGVFFGEIIIVIGFIMMIPFGRRKD